MAQSKLPSPTPKAVNGGSEDQEDRSATDRLGGALAHDDTARWRKSEPPEVTTKRWLTSEDLRRLNTKNGLIKLLDARKFNVTRISEILRYEEELALLQIELVKLQRWVNATKARVAVIFEGRDAAGKGGTIRRFTENLNPRSARVVALPKPTLEEQGQWYFQRYVKQLPNPGELVFFDRSWYNRAVVEPVNGFCSKSEYDVFMRQCPEFEHLLYEDGLHLVKFWFAISKKDQKKRFLDRQTNPLKQWKISPVDDKAQELWEKYTEYKDAMLSRTHTAYSPWIVVSANAKRPARLETIRYVLSQFDYEGKSDADVELNPDPNIVSRYHRKLVTPD